MGRAPKIHMRHERTEYGWTALCGDPAPERTTDARTFAGVTRKMKCKRCCRRMNKKPPPPIAQVVEVAFQEIEPLTDPETGMPVLTRETYQKRNCQCGGRLCAVCRHFHGIEAAEYIAPYREGLRPQTKKRYRWPSAGAALEWYALSMIDGYPQASLSEALMRVGKVGHVVQSSASGDSKAIQDADDRATIASALAGVDPRARALLLAASAGAREITRKGTQRAPIPEEIMAEWSSLPAAQVKSLIKRARRRVRAALSDKGAIPPSLPVGV